MRAILIIGLLGLAPGCAPSARVVGPETTVTRYLDALARGDAEAVHALLDEESRARFELSEVAAAMESNRVELEEQRAAIEVGLEGGLFTLATLEVESGEKVRLELESGRWRIAVSLLGEPELRDPRDAVRAMRAALSRRSMIGVSRVLSRESRQEVDSAIERFLDDTADELDLEYEVEGNRAIVRTTSGRELELVRESGEWRVVRIE